ncbi:MAG: hypothetical protein JWN86_1425 [Planctomycetota bacterium]|nr:hypothetical protein [Planctomycetota bacterium]
MMTRDRVSIEDVIRRVAQDDLISRLIESNRDKIERLEALERRVAELTEMLCGHEHRLGMHGEWIADLTATTP